METPAGPEQAVHLLSEHEGDPGATSGMHHPQLLALQCKGSARLT